MDFFELVWKEIKAVPLSKDTGPGLVHGKCFLRTLHGSYKIENEETVGLTVSDNYPVLKT